MNQPNRNRAILLTRILEVLASLEGKPIFTAYMDEPVRKKLPYSVYQFSDIETKLSPLVVDRVSLYNALNILTENKDIEEYNHEGARQLQYKITNGGLVSLHTDAYISANRKIENEARYDYIKWRSPYFTVGISILALTVSVLTYIATIQKQQKIKELETSIANAITEVQQQNRQDSVALSKILDPRRNAPSSVAPKKP